MLLAAWIGKISSSMAAWPCGRVIFIQHIVDRENSHAAGSMDW